VTLVWVSVPEMALPLRLTASRTVLCMGFVQIYADRPLRGLAEFERALQLNPSDASVHAHIGFAKFCLGRAEETEAHVRETFRLSPRNTFIYLWMVYIGVADLLLGRDEEAVTWLQRSIDTNPIILSAGSILQLL
jgi:tetratricopeptide (TPR) repeat protein